MDVHKRSRARRKIVQGLYQWQMTAENMLEIVKQLQMDGDNSKVDMVYVEQLLSEIPKVITSLDSLLQPYLDRPLAEVDLIERAVLRLAVYELQFRPEIPYKVVINEAIRLTKVFGAEQGYKYVNSILDLVAKHLINCRHPIKDN